MKTEGDKGMWVHRGKQYMEKCEQEVKDPSKVCIWPSGWNLLLELYKLMVLRLDDININRISWAKDTFMAPNNIKIRIWTLIKLIN